MGKVRVLWEYLQKLKTTDAAIFAITDDSEVYVLRCSTFGQRAILFADCARERLNVLATIPEAVRSFEKLPNPFQAHREAVDSVSY